MASSDRSAGSLKRASKELTARERRASTWLVRLGLFLALLTWAYDEYNVHGPASGSSSPHADRLRGGSSKQMWWYVGGLMGACKLVLRWYFLRERRELDERLLQEQTEIASEERPRASKKAKRTDP